MKRAVFEIKQSPSGSYYFTLKSPDEFVRVISCNYPDRAGLEKCLANIRDTVAIADDCNHDSRIYPCFEMKRGADDVTFSLIGFDGEILFTSEPYPDLAHCRQAIGVIKASAQRAGILDLTDD